MHSRLARPLLALVAAALAVTAAPAVAAAASPGQVPGPVIDPVPIGPNEYFTGLVNGHPPGTALIYVVCPGPATVGQTGVPLGNQPVQVQPAPAISVTPDLGYTGSAANSITASLSAVASTLVIARFAGYYITIDIPTDIRVPCSGSGTVVFTPTPGSATAHAATLPVTFVNVAV